MKKQFLSIVIVSMLTPFFLCGQAKPVFAESQPMNLTVSPVSLSLETKPATTIEKKISIRNNSEHAEELEIVKGSFVPDQTGEHPQLRDAGPEDSFLSWAKIEPTHFTVQPNQWQDVMITFTVPADAALTYNYSLIIGRKYMESEPGKTIIQGAPAILALVTVDSPNVRKQVEVTEFKTDSSLVEYLPQSFKVKVHNTGNVPVVPSGNIFVDSATKKDLAVLPLNSKALTVLPQSTRTFVVNWEDGFPLQLQKNTSALQSGYHFLSGYWDLSKADRWRMGKYGAHLLLVYDNGQRDVPVESTLSFWIIPWKIFFIFLITVVLCLIGLKIIVWSTVEWIKKVVVRQKEL